jgi:hypothetical protein
VSFFDAHSLAGKDRAEINPFARAGMDGLA